jgi:hypothetical protein
MRGPASLLVRKAAAGKSPWETIATMPYAV